MDIEKVIGKIIITTTIFILLIACMYFVLIQANNNDQKIEKSLLINGEYKTINFEIPKKSKFLYFNEDNPSDLAQIINSDYSYDASEYKRMNIQIEKGNLKDKDNIESLKIAGDTLFLKKFDNTFDTDTKGNVNILTFYYYKIIDTDSYVIFECVDEKTKFTETQKDCEKIIETFQIKN